jgi:NADH:ubiquinone oxidoreductase subunit 6 (subunit J)
MTKKIVPNKEIGSQARANLAKKTSMPSANWKFPLTKMNFIVIGIGIVFIVVGYLLMGTGITEEPALLDNAKWNNPMAIVVAPIFLLLGYCVIIPYGILKRFIKKEVQTEG